jgi:acyl carrier protein
MDKDAIRNAVFVALHPIAPEVTPGDIREDAPLRDQVDLDSMDFFHLVVALHESLGVDIPEQDYARLTSIDAIVDYLHARLSV